MLLFLIDIEWVNVMMNASVEVGLFSDYNLGASEGCWSLICNL